jgi:CarD family transcriptional regulator
MIYPRHELVKRDPRYWTIMAPHLLYIVAQAQNRVSQQSLAREVISLASLKPGVPMSDFKIGDKAVYPKHGVGEIVGVDTKEISGSNCAFLVLRVYATGMQIMVPKEKAAQVGLRHIASHSEINDVFEILGDKDVHIDKQTWNRRYRGFMEKIKTGSLFDVAEVYRDLYRLKSSKVLSFGERSMLDSAKQLIVKEVAVARKWPEDKTEKELEKACAA